MTPTPDLSATEVAALLADRGREFIEHLLPSAEADPKNPDVMRVGSVAGEAGKSLVINLAGRHKGTYIDWSVSGRSQDFIRLIMENRGLSIRDAYEFACGWLGLAAGIRPTNYRRPIPTPEPKPQKREPSDVWLRLQPQLRRGTMDELALVAARRQLPAFAGLQLATDAGQLFFCEVFDAGTLYPSWLLTDGSRRNAQARRMDGGTWEGIGGKKAKTIAGCEARWPVGITEVGDRDIALVEGGPDFLAAWHLIWFLEKSPSIRPVAMFGAGNSIHEDALPLFANKRVWLFPHSDDNAAGQQAASKWSVQLATVNAAVLPFDLGRLGVKDLNDLVALAATNEEAE